MIGNDAKDSSKSTNKQWPTKINYNMYLKTNGDGKEQLYYDGALYYHHRQDKNGETYWRWVNHNSCARHSSTPSTAR